jgi:hypothetical protein
MYSAHPKDFKKEHPPDSVSLRLTIDKQEREVAVVANFGSPNQLAFRLGDEYDVAGADAFAHGFSLRVGVKHIDSFFNVERCDIDVEDLQDEI